MNTFEFLPVLGIAVFTGMKFFPVGIIARIYPDFFDMFRGFHRGLGSKVNIRHQWNLNFS